MKTEGNIGGVEVQAYYVGMDVHAKEWVVTVRSCGLEIRTLSVDPDVEALLKYLGRSFPLGRYVFAYEAGFCGFWIARELEALGHKCLVVNPADIPTRDKERVSKSDKVDSRKIARELEKGNLTGIYVPDERMQALKSLGRLIITCGRDMTSIKNRIKSHLYLYGIRIPPHCECCHWSGNFIRRIEAMCGGSGPFGDYILTCIGKLKEEKARQAHLLKRLKMHMGLCGRNGTLGHLMSIPGIGLKTAIALITEIDDMGRFRTFDRLCSFVGLVPSCGGSGESERDMGITRRRNSYLRYLLVEAAWVVVRKDKALLETYGRLLRRMTKQAAIIRIAKKLLGRIRHVWLNDRDYVYCKI